MDHSGSMQATDVAPSRLAAARAAGEAFLGEVPAKVRVGGVVFDHRTEVDPGPDDRPRRAAPGAARRDEARAAAPRRATRSRRRSRCSSASRAPAPSARRARSCCCPTASRRAAATRWRSPRRRARPACRSTRSRWARRSGTLPDGKPVPPDTASLREIAERSGGEAFTAQDASGLSAVYERLGSQVAMKQEPREVTGAFAGGAIVLLLAGGGLSLRWFRRLI